MSVVAASPIPISIEISIVMKPEYGLEDAKVEIEQYIREYLNSIAFQDNAVLSYYRIGDRIFNAPGVQDITAYTVNGGTDSLTAGVGEFFRIQEVVVDENQ